MADIRLCIDCSYARLHRGLNGKEPTMGNRWCLFTHMRLREARRICKGEFQRDVRTPVA